MSKRNIE